MRAGGPLRASAFVGHSASHLLAGGGMAAHRERRVDRRVNLPRCTVSPDESPVNHRITVYRQSSLGFGRIGWDVQKRAEPLFSEWVAPLIFGNTVPHSLFGRVEAGWSEAKSRAIGQ